MKIIKKNIYASFTKYNLIWIISHDEGDNLKYKRASNYFSIKFFSVRKTKLRVIHMATRRIKQIYLTTIVVVLLFACIVTFVSADENGSVIANPINAVSTTDTISANSPQKLYRILNRMKCRN